MTKHRPSGDPGIEVTGCRWEDREFQQITGNYDKNQMEIPELRNELTEIKKQPHLSRWFKNRLEKVEEQINEMEDKAKEHLMLIPKVIKGR